MTNIMAKFMWCIARVDSRQYRQNSTELAPENFWVGVEVPLEKEYIFNADEIWLVKEAKTQWELNPNNGDRPSDPPSPIYTAKALQFCLDKLGEYLHDPDEISPNDFKQEPADDWGDEKSLIGVGGVLLPNDEIDWSDNAEPSAQTKEIEEIWNENDGDPDEKWNDKEESWE